MKPFEVPAEIRIYTPKDIEQIIDELGEIPIIKNKKDRKAQAYNVACAFDIETTSFYENDEKKAIMCCWSFCIHNYIIFGRTWSEYIDMLQVLKDKLKINSKLRLVIYVHNLSWEFQFIRKHFEWSNVFAIDVRKPIYAITNDGFEYRCSFVLSGYSLAKVGDNLTKYKVKKMVGSWDYNKIRHTSTDITNEEKLYSCYDVLVVAAYINERIEIDGNICLIPYTKTGYVRQDVRKECFNLGELPNQNFQRWYYTELIQNLSIEPDEMRLLKDSFQGGFVHSNPNHTNKILYNVDSDDFTSSYPYVMVGECEFPISKGKSYTPKNMKDFREQLRYYACVFEIYFEDIKSKIDFDFYISSSHCDLLENPITSNGRVVSADKLATTITGIDFEIIEKCYTWKRGSVRIGKMYRYRKGYLPKEIVKSVLKFYQAKTVLKGVKGKEIEYLAGKENVNSIFGMCAYYPIRTEYVYSSGSETWELPTIPDFEETLQKYNTNKGRFLTYAWSPFLTALARRNLWSGILELKQDYIYADTDSVKYMNREKHIKYFKKYNEMCILKLQLAMEHFNLPTDSYKPKTIKGEEKILGVWDWETKDDIYTRFKTLGAKRYMYQCNDGIHITIAGLGKKIAADYMCNRWSINRTTKEEINNPFDTFQDGMYIPPEYTGKQIHTYIDNEQSGVLTDYNGKKDFYHELSSIHLSPCEYRLGVAQAFLNYIFSLNEQ